MGIKEDAKLCEENPEEYYKRLYRARAYLLDKGFTLSEVEGTSLGDCEDKIKRHFVIKLPYNSKWTIIDDHTMPSDMFTVNDQEFKIPITNPEHKVNRKGKYFCIQCQKYKPDWLNQYGSDYLCSQTCTLEYKKQHPEILV